MDPLRWLLIIPIILLVALSSFFSSTETAFACLNKYFFIVKAENGDKKAKQIVKLYEKFDDTLISVLIGYNVCSVVISTLSTLIFISLLSGYFNNQIISLFSSIFVALLSFIFGDSLPKIIAKNNPSKIAMRNVQFLNVFIIIFYPLTMTFSVLVKVSKKIFKTNPPPELTEEDFTNVVEQIEAKGEIEANESEIIQASFDFTETPVMDVLTPVSKMEMIDFKNLNNDYLIKKLNTISFSRIPVFLNDQNNVVGILIVKKYFNSLLENPRLLPQKCLQKPYIVNPNVMIDDLLEGFKNNHTQIAIVKNNNKVLGMVTSEDVLEELVGKINETKGEVK